MIGKIINDEPGGLSIRGIDGYTYTSRQEIKHNGRSPAQKGLWVSFTPIVRGRIRNASGAVTIKPSHDFELIETICNEWEIDATNENLEKYFYKPRSYHGIAEGKYGLVIGRKGAGKTAIAEYLATTKWLQRNGSSKNPVTIKFKSEMQHDIKAIYKYVELMTNSGSTESLHIYRCFWDFVILREICYWLSGVTKDKSLHEKLTKLGFVDGETSPSDNIITGNIKGLIYKAFPKLLGIGAGAVAAVASGGMVSDPMSAQLLSAVTEKTSEFVTEIVGEKAIKPQVTNESPRPESALGENLFDVNELVRRNLVAKKIIKDKIESWAKVDDNFRKLPFIIIFDELDGIYAHDDAERYYTLIGGLVLSSLGIRDDFKYRGSKGDVRHNITPLIFMRDDVFNEIGKRPKISTNAFNKWRHEAYDLNWNFETLNKMLAHRISKSANKADMDFDQAWIDLCEEEIDTSIGKGYNKSLRANVAGEVAEGEIKDWSGSFVANTSHDIRLDKSILMTIYESTTRVPRDYIVALQLACENSMANDKPFIDRDSINRSSDSYSNNFYEQLRDEISSELERFEDIIFAVKRYLKKQYENQGSQIKVAFADFNNLMIESNLCDNEQDSLKIADVLYKFGVIANEDSKGRYFAAYRPGSAFTVDRLMVIHRGLWKFMMA